jgi:predicted GIY-YIG superfamily endonuclease
MTYISSPNIERKNDNFVQVNPLTSHIDIEPVNELNEKSYDSRRSYWLYALRLQNGKYYVGYTGRSNPYDRILQHGDGSLDGAAWTRKHKPIEVIEIRQVNNVSLRKIKALEQNLTWAYMNVYGTNRVRGGIFNYPGRILRVGDRIIMGYMFDSFLAAFSVMFLSAYILLRHYLNWW